MEGHGDNVISQLLLGTTKIWCKYWACEYEWWLCVTSVFDCIWRYVRFCTVMHKNEWTPRVRSDEHERVRSHTIFIIAVSVAVADASVVVVAILIHPFRFPSNYSSGERRGPIWILLNGPISRECRLLVSDLSFPFCATMSHPLAPRNQISCSCFYARTTFFSMQYIHFPSNVIILHSIFHDEKQQSSAQAMCASMCKPLNNHKMWYLY